MFNFTPLLGARSPPSASQSLLELDGGVKVLIDVGWDEHFTVSKLEALERHVPSLSIILLTHATPSHLGAFAHCCKNIPLFTQIPIYATTPVISLGRTLLQDIYSSTPLASTVIPADSLAESSYASGSPPSDTTPQLLLEAPTSDEIAHYFSLIHSLKYSQPHEPLPSAFSPPLNGLKITAYNAGHTLGGTIWHLQHGMESIVYAVDWNQVRENVFGGAAWLDASGGGAEVIEQLRKPTALICSSRGAEKSALTGGRKKRDEMLLDTIRATVAKGGTVLIPTDTSARVLELAYLLEHAWRKEHSNNSSDSPFKSAKLYLASRNVGATMRYARSMLEWMDENIVKELEADEASSNRKQHKRNDSKQIGNRDNQPTGKTDGPFEFKCLRLLERKKQVDRILSRPGARVILASDLSLEWGFSKEIFHRIAGDNSNLIVLTENQAIPSGSTNDRTSLGSLLWAWYQEKRDGVAIETGADGQNLEQVHSGGRELQTGFAARVALEGRELLAYQQYLATQRRSQTQATLGNGATLESAADAVDEASSTSSSSSDESDPDRQGKALNTSAKVANLNRTKTGLNKETLGVNILLRQPGVYDYDVRGKKGREQMFPFVSRRRRADDFGDIIRPDEYLRAEERDEVEGHDMRDGVSGKENKLGQKRKWGDAGLKDDDGEPGSSIANKRRQQRPPATDRNGTTNGDVATTTDQLDRELDELSNSSDSEAAEGVNGPSKLVFHQHSINAHIKIAFVDFAGIHDQRSLSMLIPLIQPRKLILISGSASEISYLANECRQKLVPTASESAIKAHADVYTPMDGETVNASVDTNAWTVKLSSGLVKRLRWQNVRGLGVVTLMGHLAAMEVDQHDAADSISKKRQKLLKDDNGEECKARQTRLDEKAQRFDPVLDILPASIAAATRSMAQPLHVGDLRLADLRKMLQSTGHTAEFRGEGTLLIDGLVAVRKTATGRIEVEGGGFGAPDYPVKDAEGSFHAVKRRIYDGLAVIAGG
ncbi:MAG: hypothetical protein Q9212_000093 [Teloschistes hypoglaucus]